MHYLELLVILGLGLLGITLIDTVGAIASRRLNFKYTHLIILSFLVYTTTGFFAGKKYDISTAISANAVLGLFDGTVGLWFSIILRANTGLSIGESYKMLGPKMAFLMIIVGVLFALIGNAVF